ncbi:JAB1/Mov34/MPN/PAD-1 ubiquitin protease-domain-containing protein [Flammula alnicola]|nr:JAB1/Mov34/MPN/PAD-1 ubiquitin protease-domain-containing protein [Flammula alnicola]
MMDEMERMMMQQARGGGPPRGDQPTPDKLMLKHGRAGVPMEVMGLMLGEFVDEYTVQVIDVFAMPQSGTTVTVESVDHVFQTKMVDMLKQTGRPEIVVGWYHSHPGFGCWLSSVDINTQQSFESLDPRSVAVVIDPIQSVKGKTELEQSMLMNLHKRNWTEGLKLRDFSLHKEENEKAIKSMLSLSEAYNKSLKTRHVGKQDPKRHLEEAVEKAMGDQVVQNLGTMLLAEL